MSCEPDDDMTEADAKALCTRLGITTKLIEIDGEMRVCVDMEGARQLALHAPNRAAGDAFLKLIDELDGA
ncbi:hypothetical protein [Streptomyces sp. NPDC047974]|uniref:hypothetical protein n=1 Tax=Streptomyces sp. NPDC047974 TaxID=3154343 RepID=UPI00340A500F